MQAPGTNIQRPEVDNKQNAYDPRTGQFIKTGPPKFKRFFVVKQFDGDYLLCMDQHSQLVTVALPFSLQKSTLYKDKKIYTWGGIVTTVDKDGNEVSWQQSRTVTDEASYSSTEVSTPPYILDEPIIAMHFINDKDKTVRWIDTNTSGRSWGTDKNHLAAFKFYGLGQTGDFKKGGWVKDGDNLFVLQDDMPTPFVDTDYVWAVPCGGSVCEDTRTGTGKYLVPDEDSSATGSKPFIGMTLANIRAGILDTTLSVFQYSNIWKLNGGGTSDEDFMQSIPYEALFSTLGFLTDVELADSPIVDSFLLFDTDDDKWKDVEPIILSSTTSTPAGADGADGLDGLGQDGEDGTDGTSGTDGTDGSNGTDGTPGTDGTDGATGDPGVAGDSIETEDGYWLALPDNLYSWTPARMRITSGVTGIVGDWVEMGGATKAQNSLELAADSAAGGSMQLVGDESAPGNSKAYGTDSAGAKGWIDGLPTGTDHSTLFYDSTAWAKNAIMQWWKASDATYLVFDFQSVTVRDWDATMPGIFMRHPGDATYPCGMFCNVESATDARMDLGWGGAGGGNFELYANSHNSRAGQFRAIIGPTGYYEFKKYVGGTTWKTIAGISVNGRLFCGWSDTGFPGSGDETGTRDAPANPLQIFNEEDGASCKVVAGITKDGRGYFGFKGTSVPTPTYPIEVYDEDTSAATLMAYISKDGQIHAEKTVGAILHSLQLDPADITSAAETLALANATIKMREVVVPYLDGATLKAKKTQVMCGTGYGDDVPLLAEVTVEADGGLELNGSDELLLSDVVTPSSPTSINPQSIASDASATEAIYFDTWTAGSTGVKIYVETRSGYYDTGDEKFYGYRRLHTYDKWGRLYSIGAEVRYEIEEPEVI